MKYTHTYLYIYLHNTLYIPQQKFTKKLSNFVQINIIEMKLKHYI